MAHCEVGSCREGEGKGITSICEHTFSVNLTFQKTISLTQCHSSERSQCHKICSWLQKKYCNCPLPPTLVVFHSSSLFLVPPHSLSSPVTKVRDPQDGAMSVSRESQNDENNKVLGRGGDSQVTGVPTSPLAALLPPQLQVKQLHASGVLPGEQQAQGDLIFLYHYLKGGV